MTIAWAWVAIIVAIAAASAVGGYYLAQRAKLRSGGETTDAHSRIDAQELDDFEDESLELDPRDTQGVDSAPGIHPVGKVLAYIRAAEDEDGLTGFFREYRVTRSVVRIGRASDNDLVIKDPSLSRHHAELRYRRDGAFVITDLDSLNGVYINEKRIRSKTIHYGDRLELGDVDCEFSDVGRVDWDQKETLALSALEDSDIHPPRSSGVA